MSEAQKILELAGSGSKVSMMLGYFRGLDGMRATVDVGGGRIPADVTSAYLPEINDPVQVLFIDDKPYMLGSAVPKPGNGEVTAVDGDLATVSTSLGDVIADYPDGLLVAPGDFVKLFWSEGPFILNVRSTTPEPPPVPDPPTGGVTTRQEKFTAIQAGAWQLNGSRWSSDQPRASDGYLGAWHYGTKIADTITAAAELDSIEVYIRYASRLGNPPNFALHSQPTRGGAPDLSDSFPWAVTDGWNRMPDAQAATFFAALKAGGNKRGIGLNHGGVNRFASLNEDNESGALRITFRQ
jgi:hypothetical protein